jgi:hypothetical protein
MAKKQTLKSLLGASDERVQVQFDGITPTLTPTVNPQSGYQAVVQDTPKTNQLLNLVNAMNKVPKLYAQGITIAQTEAAEDIAALDDTQIAGLLANNDKETMSIFGYNKAYNEGLVDRHYKVNAKKYADDFAALAADLDKYPTPGAFNTALENKINEIKAANEKLFGGNSFQVGHNAKAFQAVMGETITAASQAYSDNQKQEVLIQNGTNLTEDIVTNGVTTKDALDTYKKSLLDVGTPPKDINALMLENVEAIALQLIEDEQYADAQAFLNEAKKYDITGQNGLLGGGKNGAKFASLQSKLEREQDEIKEKTVSALYTDLSGSVKLFGLTLLDEPTDLDAQKEAVRLTLQSLRPNASKTALDLAIDTIFTGEAGEGRVQEFQNMLRKFGTEEVEHNNGRSVKPSELTLNTYQRLQGVIANQKEFNLTKGKASLYGITDTNELDSLEKNALREFGSSNIGIRGFMATQGYGSDIPIPDVVIKAYQTAHAQDWVKEGNLYKGLFDKTDLSQSSLVGRVNNRIDTSLPSSLQIGQKNLNETAVIDYLPTLEDEVLEYAKTLDTTDLKAANDAIDEFINSKLDAFIDARVAINSATSSMVNIKELRESAVDNLNYELQESMLRIPGTISDYTDTTDSEFDRVTRGRIQALSQSYPHLALKTGETFKGDKKVYDSVRKDVNALRITQELYGYSEYDPKAARDLQKTGLFPQEVRLFGSFEELGNVTKEWNAVLEAQADDPDGLSEEQLNTLKEAASFGVTIGTLEQFIENQMDLF